MLQILCELPIKKNHIRNLSEGLGIQCFQVLLLSKIRLPTSVFRHTFMFLALYFPNTTILILSVKQHSL